jgi:bromodomain-containing factor 1
VSAPSFWAHSGCFPHIAVIPAVHATTAFADIYFCASHLPTLEPPVETSISASKEIPVSEPALGANSTHNEEAFSSNNQISAADTAAAPEVSANDAAPEASTHPAPLAVSDMLVTPTQESPASEPPQKPPILAEANPETSMASAAPVAPADEMDVDAPGALPSEIVEPLDAPAAEKAVEAASAPAPESTAVKAGPGSNSEAVPAPSTDQTAEPMPHLTNQTLPSLSEAVQAPSQGALGADDLEMEDATTQPNLGSSLDAPANDTQVTVPDDIQPDSLKDVPLEPQSMSNLAIDGSQGDATATAETSLTEAPRSPAKISREREEDEAEEPAAKRTKVEDDVPTDGTHAAESQHMEVDSAPVRDPLLFKEDGAPKSLVDPTLDSQPITPYQNRHLRTVLALVKKTKAGLNFKLPVATLWPGFAAQYLEKIKNPIDLSVMEQKLRAEKHEDGYATMGEFKADIDLLVQNCVTFNGADHEIVQTANSVKDTIYMKMAPLPAAETPKPEKKESKHHPSRHNEARAASQPKQPAKPQGASTAAQEKSAARRQSRGGVASPAEKSAPANLAIEAQTFAVPATGIPLIRRGSAKGDNDRPKRPVHPPKNRDFTFEPKKKRKLPPEQRFLEEVLNELMKSKYQAFNAPFLKPVDAVALHIPEYHKVVDKPMDLETIQMKLQEGFYAGNSGPRKFEADFRQIVRNSVIFNGEEHEVTVLVRKLEELFDQELAKRDLYMAKHNPAASGSASAHASPVKDDDSESDDDGDADEPDPDEAKDQATLDIMTKNLTDAQAKLNEAMSERQPDIRIIELQQNIIGMIQKNIVEHKMKMAQRETSKPKAKSKPKASRAKKAAAGGAGTKRAAGGAKKAGGAAKKTAKKIMGEVEKQIIAAGINDLDGGALERAIEIIKGDTSQTVSSPLC